MMMMSTFPFLVKSIPTTLVMSTAASHNINYHQNSTVTCIAKNFIH